MYRNLVQSIIMIKIHGESERKHLGWLGAEVEEKQHYFSLHLYYNVPSFDINLIKNTSSDFFFTVSFFLSLVYE